VVKEKVLATYSFKYAQREYHRRQEAITWAQKLIDSPEGLRSVIKKGGKSLIKHTITNQQTGKVTAAYHQLSLDQDRIKELEKWDGLNMIVTSQIQMSDEQILEAYHGLWQIEESFKITKSQLEGRPVYVWSDEHIQAHFLTCFLSLVVLRLLQLKSKMTISDILQGLKSAQAIPFGDSYYKITKLPTTTALERALNLPLDQDYTTLSDLIQLRKKAKKTN
jgi:transposase